MVIFNGYFPIREDGLNHHAQRLQLHEAKAIASDPILRDRVITSYELMLDFYGMKLADREKGILARGDNWKQRYSHLNRSFHNYLRITRILKCFGEVGLEHFKIHFCRHILKEIYENKELLNCHESCVKYWTAVLRDESDRNEIRELIATYEDVRPTRHNRSPSSSDDNSESRGNYNEKRNEEEKKTPSPVRERSPAISSSDDENKSDQETKPSEGNETSSPEVEDSPKME